MAFDKTKQVDFDFEENGICSADNEGKYDAFYCSEFENGVDEVDAIWQWLVAEISTNTTLPKEKWNKHIFNYIERLCYLARENK